MHRERNLSVARRLFTAMGVEGASPAEQMGVFEFKVHCSMFKVQGSKSATLNLER
jgi:hypothetical protein